MGHSTVGTKGARGISRASKLVIQKVASEYSLEAIQLGSNLISYFSRNDVTLAIHGDKTVIDIMATKAVMRGWIKTTGKHPHLVPDPDQLEEALKWMKLIRSVSTNR